MLTVKQLKEVLEGAKRLAELDGDAAGFHYLYGVMQAMVDIKKMEEKIKGEKV